IATMSPRLSRRPSRTQSVPSLSSTRPASMRGSRGARQAPSRRTNVGRFVVEKKPSGRTPSGGAGGKGASGASANFDCVKSGGGKVVTPCNLPGRLFLSQRLHGIDTRRPPRRPVRGEQRNRREQHHGSRKRRHISRVQPEQKSRNETRGRERQRDAE